MIKIIYEDNHLLVVEKPCNLAVCEDESQDLDLLNMLKDDLVKRFDKPGDAYLGLVHRLDRPVGGVMVFAKTSKAASRLSKQITNHEFVKQYHAVVCGYIKESGTLVDYLYKNKKTNTVNVCDKNHKDAKFAQLDFETIQRRDDMALVKVNIKTGRSHQIRVQFSSRNSPLYGDQRYNKKAVVKQQIALWATSLTITHPVTKERMTFYSDLPKTKPFNQFSKERK